MKSKLKRTRLEMLPPIPRLIQDVVIPDDWCQTWKKHTVLAT